MPRYRLLLITSFMLLSATMFAEDSLPIIEMKADRTMIYPQRMELTGEETLMDVLQLVPDLMIAGYEDVIENYNLRIDNAPINGDTRLILSQMKAKDIAKIQVCDNTGVAKGTIALGRVLDINMKMPEGVKGFVEGQGDFGKDVAGIGTVNTLYGSKTTDLYANASYRHQNGNEEYLTLHMTNRFDDRNKRVSTNEQEFQQYAKASYCILLVMGAGTLMSWLLAKTGVTFPTYFGALILAAIVRNTIGFFRYKDDGKWEKADKLLDMERIVSVGNICLSMFLGMAMISLKLWELQSLALPLVVILVSQVVMMDFFVYFVAFPLLGRSYDAAVLCAGMCGFGLGATPNAMANMSAVCYKYRYTVKPFLIVPIIGAMFADLLNTGIITLFLNLL